MCSTLFSKPSSTAVVITPTRPSINQNAPRFSCHLEGNQVVNSDSNAWDSTHR
eukprot:m.69939 g.69939  ORF g.69939 m.69939 type:complete len:53 (-) comp24158_c0_seq1:338-496(-)